MPIANDDVKQLSEMEAKIVMDISESMKLIHISIRDLIEKNSASLELAGALEDAGNNFLELSEEVSTSYSRRGIR